MVGDDVELLHDAHERLDPRQAREFLRRIEDAALYFVEDLLAPEDAGHFRRLHDASPVPLAVGELFTTRRSSPPCWPGPTSTSPGSGCPPWAG